MNGVAVKLNVQRQRPGSRIPGNGEIAASRAGAGGGDGEIIDGEIGILLPDEDLPLEIRRTTVEKDGVTTVKLEITAENTLY